MGLIGNHSLLNKSFQRTYGGTTTVISFHMNSKSSLMTTSILRQRGQLQFKKAAIPTGYIAGSAIMIPWVAGELGAIRIDGAATVAGSALSAKIAALNSIAGTSTVTGAGNALGLLLLSVNIDGEATAVGAASATSSLSAALTAAASIAANLGATIPIGASSAGVASPSAGLKGTGRMGVTVAIGGTGYLSNNDVERLAIAVWDEPTTDHATAGTTGKALSDAGSAGNPWSANLADNTTDGTFGYLIQKLLKFATFMGLK